MGGSSSQVVGYRYYAKFAAFIGNRIEKFIGINFDNRKWILHDPKYYGPNFLQIYEPNLFGENEGGVAGVIDIHTGLPEPEPNPTYQQYFPLVSGYPYQSYLVFRGFSDPIDGQAYAAPAKSSFYLGNSGYMKEMLLWVKRIHVKNNGDGQWYDKKSEVGWVTVREYQRDPKPTYYMKNKIFYKYPNQDQQRVEVDLRYDNGIYSNNHSTLNSVVGVSGSTSSFTDLDEFEAKFQLNFGEMSGAAKVIIKMNVVAKNYSFDIQTNSDFYAVNLIDSYSEYEELGYKQTVKVYEVYLDISGGVFLTSSLRFSGPEPFMIFGNIQNEVYSALSITKDVPTGDINPIHKIREILTDDTAMGKPESEINNVNFMKAADRIWDEALGISWAIDEKSCIEAIEELCYHIEAGIRVNRQTGLYEMVLFRDDWFEESEIHTISENRIKDLSLEVMNSDDIVNQLNVTYYDRERIKNSTFSVYENGSILTMGHANAESVEFPYFMNMRNAEIVANWKLKQFSTPAWAGSFSTGWREARKWNRYDLIRLPWSSKWNGTILVRIMKINLGNGTDNTVTLDFEEVIPYSGEMSTSIVVDAPADSAPQPPQPSESVVFEAPYYLTVLRVGQTNADLELSHNPDIGYVAAIAAKPQSNSINALLYTDGGVGEFEQVSRLDYCDILQLDQPIDEIASAFVVTGSLTQTANSNNLILLNDELMGFVSFNEVTKVLTVKRGVLDTVPKKHNSGHLFIFDLPDVAFDSTQYAQSEVVEAQVLTTTPSGIQELSETGMLVEIQSRAIRPYPPANVKINNIFMPLYIEGGLQLTWSDRNRLQQTGGEILGYFEGSVALETNTQTLLTLTEYDIDDVELITHSENVTATNTFTLEESQMQPGTRRVHIVLKTVRNGFECINTFDHTVLILNLTAPSNVIFEVIEI